MGATRDVALNELPVRGISINPISASGGTTPITVVASDSGVMFVNRYASATTYNLPAVADGKGKMFWFYDGVGQTLIVYGPASSTVYGPTSLGQTLTGTADIGICVMVVGDGDYYYAFCIHGGWAIT